MLSYVDKMNLRVKKIRSVVYTVIVVAFAGYCNLSLEWRLVSSLATSSPDRNAILRDKWKSLSFLVKAGSHELYPDFHMVLTDENEKCLFLEGSAPEHARGTEREKCAWAARQKGYKDWFFIHNSVTKCNNDVSMEKQKSPGVFVILGAHFGASCLRVRASGCPVICVEPDKEMAAAMEHSAIANEWDGDDAFTVLAVAAGEYSQDNAVTTAWRRENLSMAKQTVPMLAIGTILPASQDVEMLFIDIDGHDGVVLRGLLKLLEHGKVVRNIVLESWAGQGWRRFDNITQEEGEALVDHLYDFGYQAFVLKDKRTDVSFEAMGATLATDLVVNGPDPVYSVSRETMQKILYMPYLFRYPNGQMRSNTVKHFWFTLDQPRRPSSTTD